jgi:hypothetical protein
MAPSLPAPPQTEQISRSTKTAPPSPIFNSQHINMLNLCGGVHNTHLMLHSPNPHCPMCGQLTYNTHMACNCPSMSGIGQDRHNNALQLLLSLLERHNGGRWEPSQRTLVTNPTNLSAPPLSSPPPLAPAGGAAAAAPEGGALVGPSAITPTSSWWALVAL